jgi:glycosyltransferase involved in cell wall biosynthesis
MADYPRVAFFPDTYAEIDGVANTSRQFEAFARKRGLPFLTVCGGTQDSVETDGSVTRMTRRRGPIGFALDKNHVFDFAFWRHISSVEKGLRAFNPDVIHVTGPSDVGQLGVFLAHRLRVPLAASWHTNVHEYLEQRTNPMFSFLPANLRTKIGAFFRESSLSATLRFYKIAQMLFAPNQELMELLASRTNKPVYPMHRGVNSSLFKPRDSQSGAGARDLDCRPLTIGYVGRLTKEKNIRFLAELEDSLLDSGFSDFRFLIVGQGAEEPWLRANMDKADFTGVLSGESLAAAYASMDVFVFPSRTDTYGNVVLEALASGVPAIVTEKGGPQFLIIPGETGFIARTPDDFVAHIRNLADNPHQLQTMREASRAYAVNASWDKIFDGVYADYARELRNNIGWQKSAKLSAQATVATERLG